MAVLRETFELARLAGLHRPLQWPGVHPGGSGVVGVPGMDHRQLAQTIRRMLDRYDGRLPRRTLTRVTGAAAAGQWEKAVNRLITALSACAVPITTAERDELRTVLAALHMPGHRAEALPPRP